MAAPPSQEALSQWECEAAQRNSPGAEAPYGGAEDGKAVPGEALALDRLAVPGEALKGALASEVAVPSAAGPVGGPTQGPTRAGPPGSLLSSAEQSQMMVLPIPMLAQHPTLSLSLRHCPQCQATLHGPSCR